MRLLAGHPEFEMVVAFAHSDAGKEITEVYPHLTSLDGKQFEDYDAEKVAHCEVVFCALPHGEAMSRLPSLDNSLIIDLGSDFRLGDAELYKLWYKRPHSSPEELGRWTYGLPELFKEDILVGKRIANPGCYPTACSLALAPILGEDLEQICISATSGTSGAGKVPKPTLHFAHNYEDVVAYKVAEHQHTPEIEMVLSRVAKKPIHISFTPHLVPAVRGIHATCFVKLQNQASQRDMLERYRAFYQDAAFVHIRESPQGTKAVRGSNHVYISPKLDTRTNTLIVTSVIDNLVKGASGQAIQNANIACGLDETCGLHAGGLYP